MSEPIKVGDLVMVVRPHFCMCGLGNIFVVSAVAHYASPLSTLKRIPPHSELEGAKKEEELTA